MKKYLIAILAILLATSAHSAPWKVSSGQTVRVSVPDGSLVVGTALDILKKDFMNVLDAPVQICDATQADIVIRTVGKGPREGFSIEVSSGKLIIEGSDPHGTAYGILEVSRLMGVSPWEWWADVTPSRLESFRLPSGFRTEQSPSVEYRGIFINDEDWGMMPWSGKNYEPTDVKGQIGPKTHEKIFELLLRLRANAFWPAMHEVTYPFFMTPGNREVAEKYGIYMGTSHCEPLLCSTPIEWPRRATGEYNWLSNRQEVCRFWEQRVQETAGQPVIYTLGMRGLHDGKMNGADTPQQQKDVLTEVLATQRDMIARHSGKEVTKIPQVFIPYKEVLDVYNTGLEVPEDVTLMWCDDNYGYIRHFPTEAEASRKGGNGIYYHVSYWGRPHDYLWLGTASPYLLYQQMSLAYEKDIRKMWILNVGDLKPAEYQIELFMDMAWDIDAVRKQGVRAHLEDFAARNFGAENASDIASVLHEHYRLAFIRKPEHMGNTRDYEKDRIHWVVKDLPWSLSYIEKRLDDYKSLSHWCEAYDASGREDAFYHLVKYPVQGAYQMNLKLLTAQKARHGLASWEDSDAALDSIKALTAIYNKGICNDGKWDGMMDWQPRRRKVFEPVKRTVADRPMAEDVDYIAVLKGGDCSGKAVIYDGLGYSEKSAMIPAGSAVSYKFKVPDCSKTRTSDRLSAKDDRVSPRCVEVDLRFLPVHPVSGTSLRVEVSLDGSEPVLLDYATVGASEEWKLNVLCNQAIRRVSLPLSSSRTHVLTVRALDEGVVLDEIRLQ